MLDLVKWDVNHQMAWIYRVAALPDGGAFIYNHDRSNQRTSQQVLRINVTGQVIEHVHQCVRCRIDGLLVLNNNLYVIYENSYYNYYYKCY